ncbi:MAG: hypothetical protein ACR2LL_12700 [Nitrosopumilus sp.]
MSDMRFTIIGIALIFTGFIILGVFGSQYQTASIESNEFETCYEYSDDMPPQEINCSFKLFDQTVFFALIIGFIGAGVIALIKGVRGNWDNKVNPADMVGPGRQTENSDDSDKD